VWLRRWRGLEGFLGCRYGFLDFFCLWLARASEAFVLLGCERSLNRQQLREKGVFWKTVTDENR
jgi:hypothetical protein